MTPEQIITAGAYLLALTTIIISIIHSRRIRKIHAHSMWTRQIGVKEFVETDQRVTRLEKLGALQPHTPQELATIDASKLRAERFTSDDVMALWDAIHAHAD